MGKDVLTECLDAAKKSFLSVGSGDGSQQVAIVKSGHSNILVTFFDTKEVVTEKYPDATKNIEYLEKNCTKAPMFGVDATQLDARRLGHPFDLIFFTFPHTGIPNSSATQVESNRTLLKGFVKSSGKLLTGTGEIQITIKNDDSYKKWGVESLLQQDSGLRYAGAHTLDKGLFPGYTHRLTVGQKGKLKEVVDKKGASVHVFHPSNKLAPDSDFEGTTLTVVTGFDDPADVSDANRPEDLSADMLERTILQFVAESPRKKPPTVLDIRRSAFAEPPEVVTLNRTLYSMAKRKVLRKLAPAGPSKKPRWAQSS